MSPAFEITLGGGAGDDAAVLIGVIIRTGVGEIVAAGSRTCCINGQLTLN